ASDPAQPQVHGSGATDDIAYYTCPMHSSVRMHAPGKCPICSMELTPVTREQEQAGVIRIDESRRSQLGIRTTKVTRTAIDAEITAKGRIAVDEARLHDVTLKVGGY